MLCYVSRISLERRAGVQKKREEQKFKQYTYKMIFFRNAQSFQLIEYTHTQQSHTRNNDVKRNN